MYGKGGVFVQTGYAPINMMPHLPPPGTTWGISGGSCIVLTVSLSLGVGYLNNYNCACALTELPRVLIFKKDGRDNQEGACERRRKQAHSLLFKYACFHGCRGLK